MIYVTQLAFIKEGKEKAFEQFEESIIPLIEKYNGRILYRIRPPKEAFIVGQDKAPYEIQFMAFKSENDVERYVEDDNRERFLCLKEDSVRSMFLVKGEKMKLESVYPNRQSQEAHR